ncbi:MucR family transcriptional regulator [Rhizobium binxianense]
MAAKSFGRSRYSQRFLPEPPTLPPVTELSAGTSIVQREEKPVPVVLNRKTVTSDFLRHLATHYDLTPDTYRQKWGPPTDYPMVAPNYSTLRSGLAKIAGLGRRAPPFEVVPPLNGRSWG